MKKAFAVLPAFLLVFAFLALPGFSTAQTDTKEQKKQARLAHLKTMVEAKTYLFTAQQAIPMSGRTRQLSTEYTLKIRSDTLVADLPYFGRAYTAPINSSDGGIHFTSTRFDYQSVTKKDGSWEITITVPDASDNFKMNLRISESGYANLQVTSNSRQPITFYGVVDDSN